MSPAFVRVQGIYETFRKFITESWTSCYYRGPCGFENLSKDRLTKGFRNFLSLLQTKGLIILWHQQQSLSSISVSVQVSHSGFICRYCYIQFQFKVRAVKELFFWVSSECADINCLSLRFCFTQNAALWKTKPKCNAVFQVIKIDFTFLHCYFRHYELHGYDVSWYIVMYIDVSWCIFIYLDISWYILLYIDVSWYVLIYLDVSWCIFMYLDVSFNTSTTQRHNRRLH